MAAESKPVTRAAPQALATELVCVLRYRRHFFSADGVLAEAVRKEFLVHAQEEQGHADQIAERVAIGSYGEMIGYLQDDGPTTRRMLEEILAKEEEDAEESTSMLEDLEPLQKLRRS